MENKIPIYTFSDDQYPYTGVNHIREIVRAVVLDEEGNVAVHHIARTDMFCDQEYYETPGGGVDEGESLEEALIRECHEELGYDIEILCPIAEVNDFYNLIGRENHNHYFLARRKGFVGKHFASSGDEMIRETLYVPIKRAIELYQSQEDTLVSKLVKQRELPILLLAEQIIADSYGK